MTDPNTNEPVEPTDEEGDEGDDTELTPEERAAKKAAQQQRKADRQAAKGEHGKATAPGQVKKTGGSEPAGEA